MSRGSVAVPAGTDTAMVTAGVPPDSLAITSAPFSRRLRMGESPCCTSIVMSPLVQSAPGRPPRLPTDRSHHNFYSPTSKTSRMRDSLPATDRAAGTGRIRWQVFALSDRHRLEPADRAVGRAEDPGGGLRHLVLRHLLNAICLLYTSDAADDLLCVDLGGRR